MPLIHHVLIYIETLPAGTLSKATHSERGTSISIDRAQCDAEGARGYAQVLRHEFAHITAALDAQPKSRSRITASPANRPEDRAFGPPKK